MELPINYEQSDWKTRKAAREQYMSEQQYKCCYCNEPLYSSPSNEIMSKDIDQNLFPSNFFSWPIHLHHCHVTGMTIGAVHAKCNAVLWQYEGK